MRTTITLDDDVAVALQRIHGSQEVSFKQLVNELLRLGIREKTSPQKPQSPFRTRPYDAGRCLIGSLDNVGEVLAIIEGENYK